MDNNPAFPFVKSQEARRTIFRRSCRKTIAAGKKNGLRGIYARLPSPMVARALPRGAVGVRF